MFGPAASEIFRRIQSVSTLGPCGVSRQTLNYYNSNSDNAQNGINKGSRQKSSTDPNSNSDPNAHHSQGISSNDPNDIKNNSSNSNSDPNSKKNNSDPNSKNSSDPNQINSSDPNKEKYQDPNFYKDSKESNCN